MSRVKTIFYNLLTLTAVSLLLRMIGLSFQVYLSSKIGPTGIGLHQLIMSVYFLAATFSISGLRLTATRLAAEEMGLGNESGAKKAVRICLGYSLIASSAIALLLYFGAGWIGKVWLEDPRAVLSLRILSFSLPFLAMGAVLGGYFTAVRRVLKSSLVLVAEQFFRVGVTVLCLGVLWPRGLEYACSALALGACAGEITSFFLLFWLYRLDCRRFQKPGASSDLLVRAQKIAIPVALSAYVTMGIRTMQQPLIPSGLKKSGSSGDRALATYGIIQGMAVPLLMFPGVILHAISDLIIPELAECQAQNWPKRQCYIINRVINIGLVTSIGIMSIIFRFSAPLGLSLYKNPEVGYYLRILAPMIPILYMDLLVDGILKGIGQQISSMGYNIFESVTGLILTYFLLPRFAITGYIFILFFTRALNFFLSINRLRKCIPLKITGMSLLKMLFCIFNALILANLILHRIRLAWFPLSMLAATLFYGALLRLTSAITREDVAWFKSIFRRAKTESE